LGRGWILPCGLGSRLLLWRHAGLSEKLRDDGLGGKKMDINDKKEVDK
jgi:hypothetical protein